MFGAVVALKSAAPVQICQNNSMKNNSIVSLLVATAGTLALGSSLSAAEYKIGTVDMSLAFNSYYKTKDAQAKLSEAEAQANKELADRLEISGKAQEELKKLQEEASKPELAEKAKAEKVKVFNEKLQAYQVLGREIQEFQQTRVRQLQEQNQRSSVSLREEIKAVVDAKVKAAAYDFVFDKSGVSMNGVQFLLSSKESFDFTNEVIAELNKGKDAAKAAPKK